MYMDDGAVRARLIHVLLISLPRLPRPVDPPATRRRTTLSLFGRRATATARHPFFRTAVRRELIWHCTRRDPSRVASRAANTRYPSLSWVVGSVSSRLAS
jgi:hypothetical protein